VLAQDESASQIILGIEIEFTPSSERRRTAHFRHDSFVRTKVSQLNDLNIHSAPKDAFDCDLLVEPQFAFCMMKRSSRAYTRTRCRPIQFAVGKYAHISTVMVRVKGRSSEDSAVKKTQIFFERMFDLERCHHCMFDSSSVINEFG